jgi:dTDP-4-dehydrorhamnose 3,5-epimerase
MQFTPTGLTGAFVVELERQEDERGFFARSWCQEEFEAQGIPGKIVQCNVSGNRRRGTLRGLHYQAAPYAEAKLVRCTMGAIYDVIVDLRHDSPTRCKYFGTELTADNRRAVFVPEGFAHGFLTLVDDSEVFYQMSQFYHPGAARGIRWDDPAFGIVWPDRPAVISPRDASYLRFDGSRDGC